MVVGDLVWRLSKHPQIHWWNICFSPKNMAYDTHIIYTSIALPYIGIGVNTLYLKTPSIWRAEMSHCMSEASLDSTLLVEESSHWFGWWSLQGQAMPSIGGSPRGNHGNHGEPATQRLWSMGLGPENTIQSIPLWGILSLDPFAIRWPHI